MRDHHGVDRLHAFVDGQLDGPDRARLLEEMEANPELRREVCELKRLKDYVNIAFESPPETPARLRPARRDWLRMGRRAAAAILLGVAFAAGRWTSPEVRVAVAPVENHHVVFHLNESDNGKFQAVLKDAQAAAESEEAQVEVVANAGGLDLVRSDRSPFARQVRELMARYPNLQFVACNITLQKLKADQAPVLVEGTVVAPSAAEHILLRMEQGWSYVRV